MLLSMEILLSLYKRKKKFTFAFYLSFSCGEDCCFFKTRKEIYLDLCLYCEKNNNSPLQENITSLLKHAYNSIIIRKKYPC